MQCEYQNPAGSGAATGSTTCHVERTTPGPFVPWRLLPRHPEHVEVRPARHIAGREVLPVVVGFADDSEHVIAARVEEVMKVACAAPPSST